MGESDERRGVAVVARWVGSGRRRGGIARGADRPRVRSGWASRFGAGIAVCRIGEPTPPDGALQRAGFRFRRTWCVQNGDSLDGKSGWHKASSKAMS